MIMENMVSAISVQANELLKSNIVKDMLNKCNTQEDKQQMLAIASIYALAKENA